MALALDTIRALPKVALHDHLDGGVRPQTLIDIASEVGHGLPATNAAALAQWFFEAADSGSLVRYLETFDHTIAVMQRPEDLRRIAREFVEDQAADGVVYAEARWAPEQHLAGGMSLAEAVAAVRDGLLDGMARSTAAGTPIIARQIISAMRQNDRGSEIAELAVTMRDALVGGFDIAGPEDGFPPSRLAEAFHHLQRHNLPYTIHAGEAAGPESVWEAVQLMRADRIGHGVRIVEDLVEGEVAPGTLAAYIRDRSITLEVCPSSNLQTGIAETYADHPFGLLERLGFAVTVSCDNRLMSATSLSQEFAHLCEAFGYGIADLHRFTETALDAAFLDQPERERLRALVAAAYHPG
ncbi:adenosine deaminase [Granulicoccus sp. GXG6511]|uniref:adenosine deaminase n=1 Tax=Granulicoccus sp. GXG6511 TaxID=3381351 RepID=UPI003D7E8238